MEPGSVRQAYVLWALDEIDRESWASWRTEYNAPWPREWHRSWPHFERWFYHMWKWGEQPLKPYYECNCLCKH
jgi:hypothetical protein